MPRHITPLRGVFAAVTCALVSVSASGAVAHRGLAAATSKPGHHLEAEKSRQASHAVAAIKSRFERCFNASDAPPPQPSVEQCQDEAFGAYEALLQPSHQKEFEAFVQDLSGPISKRVVESKHPTANDVAVGASMMDLARMRAAILTGAEWNPQRGRRHPSLNRLFGQLPDMPLLYEYHVARRMQRRWVKLRNEDCAAHPVPRCTVRLDAAMAEMLDSILNDR